MTIQTRSAHIYRLWCDGDNHRFTPYVTTADGSGWWLSQEDMMLRAVAEGWRETDRGWLCPKCQEAKP